MQKSDSTIQHHILAATGPGQLILQAKKYQLYTMKLFKYLIPEKVYAAETMKKLQN